MELANTFAIDGSQIQISCVGSFLFVELVELASDRTFSLKLDSDSVTQITNGLFTDVQTMCEGLIDAAKKKYPEISLSITKGGKVTYSANFCAGVLKKEYGFTLSLEEKQLDPIVLLEKKVTFLTSEIEKIKTKNEKKIDSLTAENEKKLNDKIAQFNNELNRVKQENEQQINLLKVEVDKIKKQNQLELAELAQNLLQIEKKIIVKLEELEKKFDTKTVAVANPQPNNYYFNPAGKNIACYSLTDTKTVSLQTQKAHPCIECIPSIPNKGQHRFTIMINVEKSDGIAFGITPKIDQENWNYGQGAYWYWTSDGQIRADSRNPTGASPFGGNGSKISMLVDMDSGTLTFAHNERTINSCKFPLGKTYYIYISLGTVGNSVTLL